VSEPLLRLSGVEIGYPSADGRGRIHVLGPTSLSLAAGELLCVAGRSGSGKTSLLNVAAGLLAPLRGHVYWGQLELRSLRNGSLAEHRRRLIGYVFQGGGLVESLTAAENAVLAAIPDGLPADAETRVDRLLAELDLLERRNHFPSQLSGGEIQRAALARALFHDPPLLVIDEPTANLDRRTGDSVINLLAALRLRGRALLVASHDPHLLEAATAVLQLEN
jgi:ABC-type lipoprotein export system ATPase subunit